MVYLLYSATLPVISYLMDYDIAVSMMFMFLLWLLLYPFHGFSTMMWWRRRATGCDRWGTFWISSCEHLIIYVYNGLGGHMVCRS